MGQSPRPGDLSNGILVFLEKFLTPLLPNGKTEHITSHERLSPESPSRDKRLYSPILKAKYDFNLQLGLTPI
jgi:hypothetical protein